jgi:uncharacterized Fe-S radical SAM superfamily protein PflX
VAKNKKTAIKTSKAKKAATEQKVAKPHEEHGRIKDQNNTASLNRRNGQQPDRRNGTDRRQKNIAVAVEHRTCERRAKVNRRRQIDPTTCERDYTFAEIEFMHAMEEYKRSSGRMFPTCSEVLEVLQKLGYGKCVTPVVPPITEPTLVPDITPPLAVL